jgi:nicotinamide-nucleotide amidase
VFNKLVKQFVYLSGSKKIGVCESCTGGMLSSVITAVSGVSSVFKGGIIAYSNEVKIDLLQISKDTLNKHGAVSSEVAVLMAKNSGKLLGCDITCGITGVAGPTGGTSEKPVGNVYIALKIDDRVWCNKFLFSGDRENIQKQSVEITLKGFIEILQHGKSEIFSKSNSLY